MNIKLNYIIIIDYEEEVIGEVVNVPAQLNELHNIVGKYLKIKI